MPLPDNLLWNEYLNKVLSHVKFKYDRKEIKWELEEHMEDMYDDFISDGMNEEDAKKAVIDCMGDADEIGKELNEAHNRLLGNVWRISRIIAVILILLSILPVFMTVLTAIFSIFSSYSYSYDKSRIVSRVEVNQTEKIDDMYLKLEEVILYDNDCVELHYKTWYQPFSDSVRWTFDISTDYVTDDLGTEYFGSSGSSSAGIISKHSTVIEGFPKEAKTLIIDYNYYGRKMYFEVPLREGGKV